MCGHGTIGLAVTLHATGQIGLGTHRIETPAGVVEVDLSDPNTVTVTNVESRRVRSSVTVEVPDVGPITGDLAYGGNWFFIVDPSPVPIGLDHLNKLTQTAAAVRDAANAQGILGEQGEPVDHVIFQQPSDQPGVHSQNFVLCPGNEYDRSPCGTGSSARLACLAADGLLEPGIEIVQHSVIGSAYTLSYQPGPGGGVIPKITGQAFITARSTLVFDPADPFRLGIG